MSKTEVKVSSRWLGLRRTVERTVKSALEVSHLNFYRLKEKGNVQASYSWTDRQPHPVNMVNYEDWGNDPEARVALELLSNLIAGVGYYTEMPEDLEKKPAGKEKPHRSLAAVDKYGEDVNLDETLKNVCYTMLHKGFTPVEIEDLYHVKILPPETIFIHMDKQGKVYRYTQEYSSVGSPVNTWEGADLDKIVLFKFGPGTYGKSLLEPVGDLLDSRAQMNVDMPQAVHRWGYPIPIIQSTGPKALIESAFEDRESDAAVFIGNCGKDDFSFTTLGIDPQARFIPYIELIYYQIAEGLHAPLLLYLKNATEASATVMMESVDRLVTGLQRYIKRRVEKYLFKPLVGEPTPRMVWGMPKTGLEDISLGDLASVMPYLARNQQQDILKQYIGNLPEPDWAEDARIAKIKNPIPQQPFGGGFGFNGGNKQQDKNDVPVETLIERLNNVDTSLAIIEENFTAHKLSLPEACKLADKTISVHMQRLYPSGWKTKRDELFQKFLQEKLAAGLTRDGKVFKVSVG